MGKSAKNTPIWCIRGWPNGDPGIAQGPSEPDNLPLLEKMSDPAMNASVQSPVGVPASQTDDLLRAHLAEASFIANRYLIDHMRRLVRELDSDFDQVYLWGLISHLQLMRGLFGHASHTEQPAFDTGIKLAELTHISGLPIETVRRKLKELEAKGRIRQTANGSWSLDVTCVDERLTAFTLETIHRLLAASKEIDDLLHKNAPADPALTTEHTPSRKV